MTLGVRVLRGPDWVQDEADGGEGHLGTVVRVKAEKDTAEVVWDNGQVTTCRVGKEGKHDLRIYDNATVGVRHPDVTCTGCLSPCIRGLLWRCALCPHIHLCSRCYVIGVHDVKHPFLRFTTPSDKGVAVGRRSDVTRVRLQGLFLGARVVRGPDWQSGDADGGAGTRGVVVEVVSPESGSARNAVRVSWDSGQSLQHRLGLHGKVDLVCTEEAPGPACYVSHLPVLIRENLARAPVAQAECRKPDVAPGTGVNEERSSHAPQIGADNASNKSEVPTENNEFNVGKTVRIISDVKLLEKQQKEHGGWNPAMAQAAGKAGTIVKKTDRGDLVVRFKEEYWVFNSRSCIPAPGLPEDFIPFVGLAGILKRRMAGPHKDLSGTPEQDVDQIMSEITSTANPSDFATFCSAVVTGNIDRITQLIQQNPKFVHESTAVGTALHCAAAKGRLEAARLLVANGSSVNKGNKKDQTPLHFALSAHHIDVAGALMEMGADVNLSNEDGRTPLHLAVAKNSSQAVNLLLQHRASVNRRDIVGDTPLHDALNEDNIDPLIIEALLDVDDIDLTMTNKQHFNPLHLATLKDRRRATAKILARNSNLTAAKSFEDSTALHIAAQNNHTDIMKLLIDANAPVNARNSIQQTPLHLVCPKGYYDAARLLVENGADINATDMSLQTPLHAYFYVNPLAEAFGMKESRNDPGLRLGIYLLQRGARTDMRCMEGKTPLEHAPHDVRLKLEDVIRQIRGGSDMTRDQNDGNRKTNSSARTSPPMGKCSTCTQRDADVIILPCAHKALCRHCVGSARSCPTCHGAIKRTVDIDGKAVGPETDPAAATKGNVQQECKVQ